MKITTAQETKEFFSLWSIWRYNPESFKNSDLYDKVAELERSRQRNDEFFMQFVDLGEMSWHHRHAGLLDSLNLDIINSITLSNGTEIHAIGKNGEVIGYMTPQVIAIKREYATKNKAAN